MTTTTPKSNSFSEMEQPIVLISEFPVTTPATTQNGKTKTTDELAQADIVMDDGDNQESDEFEEVELQEYYDEPDPEPEQEDEINQFQKDRTIEITFSAPEMKKSRGISKIDRIIRTGIHRLHLMSLLGHGMVRNQWCNDPLTQAIALSLIPLPVLSLADSFQGNLQSITELETLLQPLCDWWKDFFQITRPGMVYRDYHEFGVKGVSPEMEVEISEWIPNIHAFRLRFKEREGSPDTSAQLLLAFLRALGLTARLVMSLQVVSFKFASRKPPSKKAPAAKKTLGNMNAVKQGETTDKAVGSNIKRMAKKSATSNTSRSVRKPLARKKIKKEKCDKDIDSKDEDSDFASGSKPQQSIRKPPRKKIQKQTSEGSIDSSEDGSPEIVSKYFAPPPTKQKLKATKNKGNESNHNNSPWRRSLRVQTRNEKKIEDTDITEIASTGDSDFDLESVERMKKQLGRKPDGNGNQKRSLKRNAESSSEYSEDEEDKAKFVGQEKVARNNRKQPSFKKSSVREQVQTPPVSWCEVYSEVDKRWICIDPIHAVINNPHAMEPASSATDNVLAYVVGFEEDGYVKDVTRRYAVQWGAKTRKLRPQQNKEGFDWWSTTLDVFKRSYELERDKEEDAELSNLENSEAMPTQISAFNNHPLYVLERHLKKFEILWPKEPVIGHVRNEPIYPRSCVKMLHTVETWLKEGRQIKMGEVPLKHVKSRAVTLTSKRAEKMAEYFNEAPRESGLYAEWQTELYTPKQVVNGKIPKNGYGNVDMFQPEMCPIGAVHVRIKGIEKIVKKLDIDYAEAVVGFEFLSNRCIPIIEGVVVAEEHESIVIHTWNEYTEQQRIKAQAKKRIEILQRWRRFVISLRNRLRTMELFGETIVEKETEDDQNNNEQDEDEDEDEDEDGNYMVPVNDEDVDMGELSMQKEKRLQVAMNGGGFLMDFGS